MTEHPHSSQSMAGTILQIGGANSSKGYGCNPIEVRESTGGFGWSWRPITEEEKQKLIEALNAPADEIEDLRKGNQILQVLVGNRDKEIDRLRAAVSAARDYVDKAIASYQGDPADSQFQKGFLAALEVVRDEAFAGGRHG